MRKDLATHRVAVAVIEGTPIFELAVPCEVFGINRPALATPWYDFQLHAEQPDTTVAAGFIAGKTAPIDELALADTVLVPGCQSVHSKPRPALIEALQQAHEAGARIAAICSGAFVLAEAGLLDGRRATTHWLHADELARRYPAITVDAKVLYVEDGVFTSAGTAAGIDLCLELVRRDHGTAVTNMLARYLVTPPHREGGQAQYGRLPARSTADEVLAPLLDWARSHLDRPLTIGDLARRSHLSSRTLIRRFQEILGVPPLRWLQHERLRLAQHLLETTDAPVDQVAARAGFGSAANLRHYFAEHVGVPPQTYRRTFRVQAPVSSVFPQQENRLRHA